MIRSTEGTAAASEEGNVVVIHDPLSGEHMRRADVTGTVGQPNFVEPHVPSSLEPMRREDEKGMIAPLCVTFERRNFNTNDRIKGRKRGYLKMLLLTRVCENNAHRAGHRELDTNLDLVLKEFVRNFQNRFWEKMNKPTANTIRNKLRPIL